MHSPLRLNVRTQSRDVDARMGNSLRDELLKAGLAVPEPRKRARRRKRDDAKTSRRREASSVEAPSRIDSAGGSVPGAKHVLRENQRRTARFIRDASLAGPSVEESAKRALRWRIEALIERERQNDSGANLAYYFVKGKRIKRIYVSEAQRLRLGAGELVIAALEGDHHLMSAAAAEELKALAPQTTLCAPSDAHAEPGGDHPVPDDITW